MSKVDFSTIDIIKDIMPDLISYESFVTYLENNGPIRKLQMIKK